MTANITCNDKHITSEASFTNLLRAQLDEIMTITGADPELPYSQLSAHVKAWGEGKRYEMRYDGDDFITAEEMADAKLELDIERMEAEELIEERRMAA